MCISTNGKYAMNEQEKGTLATQFVKALRTQDGAQVEIDYGAGRGVELP